jgi:hypothetical protein
MMHIGDEKGKILTHAVLMAQEAKNEPGRPLTAVELGSYCGYSAGKESVLSLFDTLNLVPPYTPYTP